MFGMIDFSMLSTEMISGLVEDEIKEISDIQAIISEDPSILFEEISDIPEEINQQLDKLENEAVPESTNKQQKKWIKHFEEFLQGKKLNHDMENITKKELSNVLRYYYSELRTKTGEYYSKSTLICIRAAIYRFFKSQARSFDIINDKDFFHANQMLKAMTKKWIDNGGTAKQYDFIEEEDMKSLRSYFDRSTPERLQEEVYFVIIYYLGLRGREWIKRIKKSSIKFMTDSKGKDYVTIEGISAIQKNDQPSLTKHVQSSKEPRIYKTMPASSCPLTAIRLFLEKLPSECELLFYKANRKWDQSRYWYNDKMPLGVNSIGSLMKTISKRAKLTKCYTAHCIRSTVVTNLFNENIPMEEISCVTGHKDSKSVKRYLRNVSDDKKQHYASSLQKRFRNEDLMEQNAPLNENESK